MVKNKTKAARIFKNFHFYFNFNSFHVLLVKVLNIMSIDQKKRCTYFTREISKLNYIHLKLSFGDLVQTLQFFQVK